MSSHTRIGVASCRRLRAAKGAGGGGGRARREHGRAGELSKHEHTRRHGAAYWSHLSSWTRNLHDVIGSGWQKGMSCDVLLTAIVPAMMAVATTGPAGSRAGAVEFFASHPSAGLN